MGDIVENLKDVITVVLPVTKLLIVEEVDLTLQEDTEEADTVEVDLIQDTDLEEVDQEAAAETGIERNTKEEVTEADLEIEKDLMTEEIDPNLTEDLEDLLLLILTVLEIDQSQNQDLTILNQDLNLNLPTDYKITDIII